MSELHLQLYPVLSTSTTKEDYRDCLLYIESFWHKVIVKNPKKSTFNSHYIPIPYSYITPNAKKFKYIFYWDTFFMFRGLLGTRHVDVMKNMVENFIYLFKKYGVIPNFNSYASTGRSQPPFLSTMIFDVYEMTQDKKWLESRMEMAKQEYTHVWDDKNNAYNHRVDGFELSKYGDRDVGYSHSAELESGWDFTSRFYNRCSDFLPVDLNCYLYKYERDFMRACEIFGKEKERAFWEVQSEKRKKAIYKYCWNKKEGFFYDYDYVNGKQGHFMSLAGFVPLWAGIAKHEDAERMRKKLVEFETQHGLVICSPKSLVSTPVETNGLHKYYKSAIESLLKPKQWDYPNIWPPIEYLAVVGLLRYGCITDAVRIMEKSLATQAKVFRKYHTFFEKIDGVKGDWAKSHHYPTQGGFGWTNAIFYRYTKLLETIEKEGSEALYKLPKSDNPPYRFSVAH